MNIFKDFPTILLTTDSKLDLNTFNFKIDFKEYTIAFNKYNPNFHHSTDKDNFVFSHANHSFLNKLKSKPDIDEIFINSILDDLNWGICIFYDKIKKCLIIKNDMYGIYPIYTTKVDNSIYFSNNFDLLVEINQELSINNIGIADILLFNYPLKNRTIFNEISRLESLSTLKLVRNEYLIEREDILYKLKYKNETISDSIEAIKKNVTDNKIDKLDNYLALTGGFDSKVLLSTLLAVETDFKGFTWGGIDSADYLSAKETSKQLKLQHLHIEQYEIDKNPIEFVNRLLEYQPNFPVVDTLINYVLVNDYLDKSNIYMGLMGGELIVGPIIKAELILTRYASFLTKSRTTEDFKNYILTDYKENCVINSSFLDKNSSHYFNTLKEYSKTIGNNEKNMNVVRFLLSEAYPKFFGTLLNIFFNKHNLIVPLVDIKHLRYILNSKYSFTNYRPFSKNPLYHFKSRGYYARFVHAVYPKILNTPMDRGYNLNHFKNMLTIIYPSINYIRRHLYQNKPKQSFKKEYINKLLEYTFNIIPTSPVNNIKIIDIDKVKDYILKYKKGFTNNRLTQNSLQVLLLHILLTKYKNKKINYENN